MAVIVLNIKICNPLKKHSGLTVKCHEICHYSYNLPLQASLKDDTTKQTDDQNINWNAFKNIDRWPTTYRPYCNWTASKPTLIADPMFFIFFPPHFFKNNFSQPTNGTFGFARHTKPTLRKTKRAIFCQRTDNDNDDIKLNLADNKNIKY